LEIGEKKIIENQEIVPQRVLLDKEKVLISSVRNGKVIESNQKINLV